MGESIHLDDLRLDVRRSTRRKTLGLTIERDGSVTVRAPDRAPRERVERFAREKREWIYRKLAEKERLAGPIPAKEFVSGESFYYLGRSYRLLLIHDPDAAPLRLVGGRFLLRRDEAERGWDRFIEWYSDRGTEWLERRINRWAPTVGVEAVPVEVRDLGYRWGSCSPHGRLFFHWRTLMMPVSIIDYLIVHELVHLLVPDHSREFWRRVERSIPDYALRREWLRVEGGGWG